MRKSVYHDIALLRQDWKHSIQIPFQVFFQKRKTFSGIIKSFQCLPFVGLHTYLVKNCKCILFLIASLGSRSINFFVPDVYDEIDGCGHILKFKFESFPYFAELFSDGFSFLIWHSLEPSLSPVFEDLLRIWISKPLKLAKKTFNFSYKIFYFAKRKLQEPGFYETCCSAEMKWWLSSRPGMFLQVFITLISRYF